MVIRVELPQKKKETNKVGYLFKVYSCIKMGRPKYPTLFV